MNEHKNSAKRIYIDSLPVYITTVTQNRFPYFEEEIFCRLFLETLNFSRWVHDFETLAYKINPDHIHLIFQPGKSSNYSEIMQTIKRNFSRDCNDLIFNRSFIRNLNSYRRRFESSPVLLQNSLNRELEQGFSGDKYDLVNI